MSAGGPQTSAISSGISEAIKTPVHLKILLAGSSGIPGRNILTSLIALKNSGSTKLSITLSVLKRRATKDSASDDTSALNYTTVYVDDFSITTALSHIIESQNPDIIISALNAEPMPILDNYLIEAITYGAHHNTDDAKKTIFFISGFTLDLLHSSVAASLSASALQKLSGKIDFAKRLQALAHSGDIQYCTVVCAAFLDYTLVKGYSGINLKDETATLVDNGEVVLTGCSVKFVGDAVAQVVRQYALGSTSERSEVINQRLRIAETRYSGQLLLKTVQETTRKSFDVQHKKSTELLEKGSIIGYLNWADNGASTFVPDGLDFGKGSDLDHQRRSLEQIVRKAIDDGVESFEGIGR